MTSSGFRRGARTDAPELPRRVRAPAAAVRAPRRGARARAQPELEPDLGDAATQERFRRLPPQNEIAFNYTGPRSWEYTHFKLAGGFGGCVLDEAAERPHLLAATAALIDGRLELRWEYSENIHRRRTIEDLARRTTDELRAPIARSSPTPT